MFSRPRNVYTRAETGYKLFLILFVNSPLKIPRPLRSRHAPSGIGGCTVPPPYAQELRQTSAMMEGWMVMIGDLAEQSRGAEVLREGLG
jgi:hypothetical protein